MLYGFQDVAVGILLKLGMAFVAHDVTQKMLHMQYLRRRRRQEKMLRFKSAMMATTPRCKGICRAWLVFAFLIRV